jgi:hypothetical protein
VERRRLTIRVSSRLNHILDSVGKVERPQNVLPNELHKPGVSCWSSILLDVVERKRQVLVFVSDDLEIGRGCLGN